MGHRKFRKFMFFHSFEPKQKVRSSIVLARRQRPNSPRKIIQTASNARTDLGVCAKRCSRRRAHRGKVSQWLKRAALTFVDSWILQRFKSSTYNEKENQKWPHQQRTQIRKVKQNTTQFRFYDKSRLNCSCVSSLRQTPSYPECPAGFIMKATVQVPQKPQSFTTLEVPYDSQKYSLSEAKAIVSHRSLQRIPQLSTNPPCLLDPLQPRPRQQLLGLPLWLVS